ncbi:hypothetical protein ABZT06_08580 [Streptomyces sp. NPDC005483]|uniref:hypothetical protein n=1 Tax=Streptomyces sp. NPDC005483 TaxID=3154882 RepID=UPI0033A0ABE5
MTDRNTLDQMNSNDLDQLYDRADRAEATLARLADYLHTSGPCCESVRHTLDDIIGGRSEQPQTTANNPATSDNGPSVTEAAADDRAYWDGGKAGEQ